MAALAAVARRASARVGALATAGAAVLGPLVSTYTAALVTDTAVPAWHDGRHALPFVFAGSSLTAAGGAGLVLAGPAAMARHVLIAGSAMEAVASERLGRVETGHRYRTGRAGSYHRVATALTLTGAALAVAGRRRPSWSRAAGLAALAASACTRLSVFHAGLDSARRPEDVIGPQRRRRDTA